MRDTEGTPDGSSNRNAADAEALARRAVQRDPAAWEQLFELHYRGVFAFVRYRLRSSDEAEDIASQAFEVAYAAWTGSTRACRRRLLIDCPQPFRDHIKSWPRGINDGSISS